MGELRFEWDSAKAAGNRRKHGVSFDEATTAFFDEIAVEFYDDESSEWEDRFLLLGMSASGRLLLVCYSFRQEEGLIRLISARKATRRESAYYRR